MGIDSILEREDRWRRVFDWSNLSNSNGSSLRSNLSLNRQVQNACGTSGDLIDDLMYDFDDALNSDVNLSNSSSENYFDTGSNWDDNNFSKRWNLKEKFNNFMENRKISWMDSERRDGFDTVLMGQSNQISLGT